MDISHRTSQKNTENSIQRSAQVTQGILFHSEGKTDIIGKVLLYRIS